MTMLNLNLLPWRETLRQKHQLRFKIAWYCSFVCCIIIIVIWHITLQQQNLKQLATLQQLQQQLYALQTQKKLLAATQQKLYNLQQQQNFIYLIENNQWHNLELLSLISKAIPPLIQLNLIEQNNNSIVLKGHAYALNSLAEFIQKIGAVSAAWLEPPSLQEIINTNNSTAAEKNFTITINNKSNNNR